MQIRTRKRMINGVICFLLTVALLLGFLMLSTLIPREAIRPRMKTSAEYLAGGGYYDMQVETMESSRIDRYADAILLGIAWQYDSANPLRSVLESKYYHAPEQTVTESLLAAVRKNLPANQQYLRYWHGSAGIVRVLMTAMTLPQIYLWHAVLLGGLVLTLLYRLLRRQAFAPAVGLTVSLILTSCWYVPLSLEYTWVFLILLVQLHLLLGHFFSGRPGSRNLFFLVSGMLTCYLDFLTCETLTVLMPLLFLLWMDREEKRDGLSTTRAILRQALAWVAGYGGMYLLKWGLAALVMGENVLPYVTDHVEQRLVGTVENVSYLEEMIGSLQRNLLYQFPADLGLGGILIGIGLLVVAAYLGYVHHRKSFDRKLVCKMAVLGLIPYLRYLVLVNHSFMHAFFTFRAQLSTLFAVVLIVAELTGWGCVRHDGS